MKKKISIVMLLVLSVSFTWAQESPAIVFETTKTSVSLSIRASNNAPESEALVWIDLNGNGVQDSGEKVTTFGSQVTYPITTATVRIYGPVWVLNCASNNITSLDVSGAAATLNNLSCNTNKLTSLDLSSCEQLATVACHGNELTSILPCDYITGLNMYSNRLSEEAMTILVNRLGDKTGKTAGKLTLYYNHSNAGQANQNVFTQAHADIIAAKNWAAWGAFGGVFTGPYDVAGVPIVFETTNTSVELSIRVSGDVSEKQDLVWIDLNGNGERDSGEKVTTFNTKITYPLETTTVRIYGPVWILNCASNNITSLDVSGAASTLNQLACNNNLLTILDLSSCEQLASVQCQSNLLTSLIPCDYITGLNMYSNRLNEEAMTVLVTGLGDRTGKTTSKLTLYYNHSHAGQPDQNVFTQAHADTIATKNWEAWGAFGGVFTGPYDESGLTVQLETTQLSNEMQVYSQGNGIVVKSTKPSPLKVYSITGQLLYATEVVEGENLIPLSNKGIYVINNKKYIF